MNEFGCRWREFRLLSHIDVVTVTMTDLAAPHHHVTDAAVLPDGTHCAHPYIFLSLHMFVNKTSRLAEQPFPTLSLYSCFHYGKLHYFFFRRSRSPKRRRYDCVLHLL